MCSPEDVSSLSQAMIRACYHDPHWRLLWGSMSLELPRNLVKGRVFRCNRKAIDIATGEIVDYARWLLPEGEEMRCEEDQVEEPSTEQLKRYEALYDAYTVNGKIKGLNNDIMESLTLDYIAVFPDRQKQGIGSVLLEDGISVAEGAGLRTYVMSTPTRLKLYEGHGFVRLKTIIQDDFKWGSTEPHVNHFLVRE
ncbi:gnat family acetyltransferase protein [Colletotrichum incanum]|uniref:Gnat family acetyltransferase protein n=1 Tax=Colletotrichum incanum TaxID=1573173 RepID=A0A167D492_COLIC|nr:gnat family acetyltransferase protein [Colletotrichum incanum]